MQIKPHIYKLKGSTINCWTCVLEGSTSRIAGFGNNPEDAWEDLVDTLDKFSDEGDLPLDVEGWHCENIRCSYSPSVVLNDEEFEFFLEVLDNPPEPTERMKEAFESYRKSVFSI